MKYGLLALVLGFAMPIAAAEAAVVTLSYTVPDAPKMGEPTITLGQVVDVRGRDLHLLGNIRGGYNNVLKTLTTEKALSEEVAGVVRAALDSRGLSAPSGIHKLDVRMIQFDCNQYARREAHAVFELTLTDVQTGALLLRKETKVDGVNGSVMSLSTGIFASPEKLRELANSVLVDTLNLALDDPEFRAALAAPAPVAPAPPVAPAVASASETPAPSTATEAPAPVAATP